MYACELTYGEGIYKIDASIQTCGKNFVVVFGGGIKHHIGAVAVGEPYPSSRGDGTTTASVSVIGVYGHKEDTLARQSALYLAKLAKVVVTTTVGIHIDKASGEEIKLLMANFDSLLEMVGKEILKISAAAEA